MLRIYRSLACWNRLSFFRSFWYRHPQTILNRVIVNGERHRRETQHRFKDQLKSSLLHARINPSTRETEAANRPIEEQWMRWKSEEKVKKGKSGFGRSGQNHHPPCHVTNIRDFCIFHLTSWVMLYLVIYIFILVYWVVIWEDLGEIVKSLFTPVTFINPWQVIVFPDLG